MRQHNVPLELIAILHIDPLQRLETPQHHVRLHPCRIFQRKLLYRAFCLGDLFLFRVVRNAQFPLRFDQFLQQIPHDVVSDAKPFSLGLLIQKQYRFRIQPLVWTGEQPKKPLRQHFE